MSRDHTAGQNHNISTGNISLKVKNSSHIYEEPQNIKTAFMKKIRADLTQGTPAHHSARNLLPAHTVRNLQSPVSQDLISGDTRGERQGQWRHSFPFPSYNVTEVLWVLILTDVTTRPQGCDGTLRCAADRHPRCPEGCIQVVARWAGAERENGDSVDGKAVQFVGN